MPIFHGPEDRGITIRPRPRIRITPRQALPIRIIPRERQGQTEAERLLAEIEVSSTELDKLFKEKGITPTTPITNIDPLVVSAGFESTIGSLKGIVEAPVLPACIELFRKGIATTQSSANLEDLERFDPPVAWIGVTTAFLSEENGQIADKLIKERQAINEGDIVKIVVPITKQSTALEIAKALLVVTHKLRPQRIRYGTFPTLEELHTRMTGSNKEIENRTEIILDYQRHGYIFNQNGEAYCSQDLYDIDMRNKRYLEALG